MNEPTDFEDLKAFILDRARMQMTHIYKPVMLQVEFHRNGPVTMHGTTREILSRKDLSREDLYLDYFYQHCLSDRRTTHSAESV